MEWKLHVLHLWLCVGMSSLNAIQCNPGHTEYNSWQFTHFRRMGFSSQNAVYRRVDTKRVPQRFLKSESGPQWLRLLPMLGKGKTFMKVFPINFVHSCFSRVSAPLVTEMKSGATVSSKMDCRPRGGTCVLRWSDLDIYLFLFSCIFFCCCGDLGTYIWEKKTGSIDSNWPDYKTRD